MIPEFLQLRDAGFTVLEARLMGLSKTRRKDGDWFEIKLQVQPADMPGDLYTVDLGTRLYMAMVQATDEEAKPKRKFEDLPRTQQAAILCKDAAFQEYLGARSEGAAKHRVYGYCCVESLADLDFKVNTNAAGLWDTLLTSFTEYTRLPEQRD